MDYFNIFLAIASAIIFYLFFIIPQKKNKSRDKEFIDNLKKGDDIVLQNGLCGKFLHFDNGKIIIEINNGVKLEFLKEALYISKSIEISSANNKKQVEKS